MRDDAMLFAAAIGAVSRVGRVGAAGLLKTACFFEYSASGLQLLTIEVCPGKQMPRRAERAAAATSVCAPLALL